MLLKGIDESSNLDLFNGTFLFDLLTSCKTGCLLELFRIGLLQLFWTATNTE